MRESGKMGSGTERDGSDGLTAELILGILVDTLHIIGCARATTDVLVPNAILLSCALCF